MLMTPSVGIKICHQPGGHARS